MDNFDMVITIFVFCLTPSALKDLIFILSPLHHTHLDLCTYYHLFIISLILILFFFVPPSNHLVTCGQWRQFTNFLGGQNFLWRRRNFFCAVMPKAPYQHPLLKSIHVLKFTKAWYACTYIEHWINESNENFFWGILGGDGPPAPQLAPLLVVIFLLQLNQ